MPAILSEIIQPQGFEIVRDRISEILVLELENQRTMNPSLPSFKVFVERRVPVDHTEIVVVNILLDNAAYENYGPSSAQGSTIYNIDVYANGKSSLERPGYLDAAIKLHRILGLCRYILQSPKYKTLGFEQGLIGGSYIRNLQIYDSGKEQDASFVQMGRLGYAVRIQENQELWQGVDLDGMSSELRLDLTDKGYKYELINN